MLSLFRKKKTEKKDDPVDFESMYTVIKELGIRGYRLRRMNILRRIWQEMVPEQGQSEWLQGELLRQIEKLRNEALGNGNINWDDNYTWFCDFISDTLKESGVFEEQEIKKITGALKYIRDCGEYARSYREGEISDDDANPMLFAYVDHDLYDFVADAIGKYVEVYPDPILYEKKSFIYR